MTDNLSPVKHRHDRSGVSAGNKPDLPQGRREVRADLLEEEVDRLREAVKARDMAGILDALRELRYVPDGAFLESGLREVKAAAFAEVHASNMGKVLTGPGFRAPDPAGILTSRHK